MRAEGTDVTEESFFYIKGLQEEVEQDREKWLKKPLKRKVGSDLKVSTTDNESVFLFLHN